MIKRSTHSPELKPKVAMEANSGRMTIQDIAADDATPPNQLSHCKRQLLVCASELFIIGKKTKVKVEGQTKEGISPLPSVTTADPVA